MKSIKNVCVVGAGVMGMQIALNAAMNGFEVSLNDSFEDAIAKAEKWTKDFLTKGVSKGKYTQEQVDTALSRFNFDRDLAKSAGKADLVIEAIIEKVDAKEDLFKKLNQLAPKNALITTNSSFMASSMFAPLIDDPSRMANLHYFNPAMHMQLVEIVRGPHTGEKTIEALQAFVRQIGKIYIVVKKEIEGFVVNRLLRAVQNEAFHLLHNEIATFEDIDIAAEKGLNYPLGPFRLLDLTGLDICYYNRMKKYEETKSQTDYPPKELVERFKRGDFGRKTGRGWYAYEQK